MESTIGALPGPAILFCPGHRPDRFDRARASADGVVVDLEDAVPADQKSFARERVAGAFADGQLDPRQVIVRINSTQTSWARDDLEALAATPAHFIMWPKARDLVSEAVFGRFSVIALCETPRGIIDASKLADSGSCVGLAWGGQDLALSLGAPTLDGGGGAMHATATFARMSVLYAAAAAGKPAIDTIRAAIGDAEGLRQEAMEASRMGYSGKLVIHPSQVPIVREAFKPDEQEVAWAVRIVAGGDNAGVSVVDGDMVDAPVLARAKALLARVRD